MDHEDRKPDRQRSQYLHPKKFHMLVGGMESTATVNCAVKPSTYRDVRITRASLRVSGREDSVNEYEGADDLSTQSGTLGVTRSYGVSTTSEPVIVRLHEGLHEPNTAYGSQALRYHVGQCTNQRNLPGQEKPKRYRRINVTTCNVLGKKKCKKSEQRSALSGFEGYFTTHRRYRRCSRRG